MSSEDFIYLDLSDISNSLLCCVSHRQGHMKTHAGALTSTPSKAQTNDTETAEDHSSHSANKNLGQEEEKQGLAKSPKKGVSTDHLPVSVVSSVAGEPMDTTV